MARLFGRVCTLTVGTHQWTALDLDFGVKRSLKPEPNTCDHKIYNLSESTRREIAAMKGRIPVRLEAGYIGAASTIYEGELRTVSTTVEGSDVVTELASGDGERAFRGARIAMNLAPRTPPDAAVRALVRALGVGEGNVARIVATLRTKGLANLFAKPGVIVGRAEVQLTELCKAADLEWSVQNGAVQILDRGRPLTETAIKLAPDTGLVESPSVDNKGILSATCLIIPGLAPGVKVSLESKAITGGYRVTHCEWSGQTAGTEWHCKITAEKY